MITWPTAGSQTICWGIIWCSIEVLIWAKIRNCSSGVKPLRMDESGEKNEDDGGEDGLYGSK
jgi:hypothetical protein